MARVSAGVHLRHYVGTAKSGTGRPKECYMTNSSYDRDQDRERLVERIMPHVPFDGWTDTALSAGATDAGIDPARAFNAFPGGMAEVLAFNHRRADERMVAFLSQDEIAGLKIR